MALADVVASVWVQRVDGASYVHRDLPSGSVELRCRLGAVPEIVGPLTRAKITVLEPGTTTVGLRLHPPAAARVLSRPAFELADQVLAADELWPDRTLRLAEEIDGAPTPAWALRCLLNHVGASLATAPADPLVSATVRELRWRADDVGIVARELSVSERHLRRRILAEVGVPPKTLQRTLRFQRFLALSQHAMAHGRAPAEDGLARLAADASFADQAHLTRECARLTGLTPGAFLRSAQATCACGHDHAAAYVPFLRARAGPARVG